MGIAAEEATVEAVKSFSRTIEVSKSDIDFASRISFNVDNGDSSVLGLAFIFDVFGEVFVPIRFGFPCGKNEETHSR